MLRAMASATQPVVSLSDYLTTSFEWPAPEFVDGELVERREPRLPHSIAQGRCLRVLARAPESAQLIAGPELRLRSSVSRIRVADVAVFKGARPTEQIPSTPPFIVIEVVSRDDRYVDILTKLEEYRAWGVQHVWLVDPWFRKLNVYKHGLEEVERLQAPECEISIFPADLFD